MDVKTSTCWSVDQNMIPEGIAQNADSVFAYGRSLGRRVGETEVKTGMGEVARFVVGSWI